MCKLTVQGKRSRAIASEWSGDCTPSLHSRPPTESTWSFLVGLDQEASSDLELRRAEDRLIRQFEDRLATERIVPCQPEGDIRLLRYTMAPMIVHSLFQIMSRTRTHSTFEVEPILRGSTRVRACPGFDTHPPGDAVTACTNPPSCSPRSCTSRNPACDTRSKKPHRSGCQFTLPAAGPSPVVPVRQALIAHA